MKFGVKRVIKARKEDLWEILGDFSNIQRFHPMLKGSHFIEGSNSCEVGSMRQCNFNDGNHIKERILEWDEGNSYTVDIFSGSLPIEYAKATLGLIDNGDGTTTAYMDMDIRARNKWMNPMMYMMYKYKGIPSILKGLEETHHKEQQLSIA